MGAVFICVSINHNKLLLFALSIFLILSMKHQCCKSSKNQMSHINFQNGTHSQEFSISFPYPK